ncbi:MAG TPA: L-histidine N(alpha)-methyltransferase [Candidatus Saccharimonadales bacterium]|nr:L-histidine N(alpha)-methyltransferase [Candidatus Saccharimonadales bacterium]
MKYYKNSELTLRYNVSDKTVRNWIAASSNKKLGLKLYEENEKKYIADSVANNYLLAQLAVTGKKYRNNRTHKILSPSQKFYDLYTTRQIIEIANSLDKYHELSWHYSYFGDAAKYWDKYLYELYNAGKGNLLTNTVETLHLNLPYIDAIIGSYKYVNVVNICIGNNLAVREVLGHIRKSGKLKRFIMMDISPDVLDISEQNTKKWFKDTFIVEKHLIDIRHETFGHILAQDSFGADSSKTANLIFFVAGPIVNFRDPGHTFKTLHDSMGKSDFLFISHKRDTDQSRGFFDFNIKSDATLLSFRHKMLPDLLNIKESFYEAEQAYDENRKLRYIQIRLKVGFSLEFKVEKFKKTVELQKGDTIRLWWSRQYSDQESVNLLNEAGYSVLQAVQSVDRELFLTISKLKP